MVSFGSWLTNKYARVYLSKKKKYARVYFAYEEAQTKL